MRLILMTAGILTLTGCASSPDSGRASSPTQTRVHTASGAVISVNTGAQPTEHALPVDAEPDAAFRAATKAFAELQIPVTTLITSERRIGNPSYRVRRQIGGTSLARYLDCGRGNHGPNAEVYQITMSVESVITAAPAGGSTVRTTVTASGVPTNFPTGAVNCTTTGELEKRIAQLVEDHASN